MAISAALGSSALLPAGLGFRNVLINGDFKIWQRGIGPTAVVANSTTTYYADRWAAYRSTNSGFTVSRQSAGLDGFQYCIRMQRDSGVTTTNANHIYQSLESVTSIPLAGKVVTISFYARAGSNYSASGSYILVGLNTGTGTDQNMYTGYTGGATVLAESKTITTSWARYSSTIFIPSGITELGVSFTSYCTGTAGTNDYVEITGVQLEQNNQATPFEQRPYGVELQLCQRYFYRRGGKSAGDIYCAVYQPASSSIIYSGNHPVIMYKTPAMSVAGTWNVINSATQPIAQAVSADGFTLLSAVNGSISNANQSGFYTKGDGTTYIQMDAEL